MAILMLVYVNTNIPEGFSCVGYCLAKKGETQEIVEKRMGCMSSGIKKQTDGKVVVFYGLGVAKNQDEYGWTHAIVGDAWIRFLFVFREGNLIEKRCEIPN